MTAVNLLALCNFYNKDDVIYFMCTRTVKHHLLVRGQKSSKSIVSLGKRGSSHML